MACEQSASGKTYAVIGISKELASLESEIDRIFTTIDYRSEREILNFILSLTLKLTMKLSRLFIIKQVKIDI